MRRISYLGIVLAVALGMTVEAVAFEWDNPARWVPDLAVGLAFLIGGIVALSRSPRAGSGVLLVATGLAWFAGGLAGAASNLHRGPLFHLFLTYPTARPRTRLDSFAMAGGYIAALIPSLWRDDRTVSLITALLAVVVWYGHQRSVGRLRRERDVALQATVGYVMAVLLGVLARGSMGATGAFVALYAYELALVATTISVVVRLQDPTDVRVADLVVELGETGSGFLRDRLATALGDPSLQVGLWSSESKAYLGDDGRALTMPTQGSGRALTVIPREGAEFAALVHDATIVTDPALVDAVAAASQLSASNLTLRSQVEIQLAELAASRRRLLLATDDERRRLGSRLRRGPEQRLADLAQRLDEFGEPASLETVRQLLRKARHDLTELGRGLHPRELTEAGLAVALGSLADQAPVATTVDVSVGRLPAEIEVTAYFVCAEALANVFKYASARLVKIEIAFENEQVVVVISDDGVGGADPTGGSGIQGLTDRVAAFGGRLTVSSPPNIGTSITAEIPFKR
ncbi:MAG TPA: ATP-binding protein [Acidimicrobiia bacterium]|nr:ATP-binding protein [Acidimicrobiia bacterium]